jgi:hypothetical protein
LWGAGFFYITPNMKIYLDNCCFNRPFDDQNDIVVRLEMEAKLFIQQKAKELMDALGLKQNKQIEGISIVSPTIFVHEVFI